VIIGDSESKIAEKEKKELEKRQDDFSESENSFLRSLAEKDEKTIEKGHLLESATNYGISSFNADRFFEALVKNYTLAMQIYGDSFYRHLTGYDENEIEKNIRLPEFQRELKKKIAQKIESLKWDKLIDKEENISEEGFELGGISLLMEELENLTSKSTTWGQKRQKYANPSGIKEYVKSFRKERYRDIAMRSSIKKAVKRGHKILTKEDLMVHSREEYGECDIIYALDASGSMKGEKIRLCKKAGLALCYTALEDKNKVGLIVFSKDIKEKIMPTDDFSTLIKSFSKIMPKQETNIALTIKESVSLFSPEAKIKHLVLITDAMPTIGKYPEKMTIEASAFARDNDVTISLVGIELTGEGKKLAEKLVEIGQGRLYAVKNLENLDGIVLEDYLYAVEGL